MASAPLDWERHKEVMKGFYVDENKTLNEVMDIMRGPPYHFFATRKQYEGQFQRKWRFRKNSTKEVWKALHFKVTKRERRGKKTNVFVNGHLVPKTKLAHEVSRYGFPELSDLDPEPVTPDGISLRSPTPTSPKVSPINNCKVFEFINNPDNLLVAINSDTAATSTKGFPVLGEPPWNTTISLAEFDLVGILSQTNPLPYFELFELFNSDFEGLHNQRFVLSSKPLHSSDVRVNQELQRATIFDQFGVTKRNTLPRAILPPNGDTSISTMNDFERSEDAAVQFLTNTAYLLCNGLGSPSLGTTMAQFVSDSGNRKFMKQLMSSPSVATEALAEELLFSLIDAGDDQLALPLLEQGKVTPHSLHLTEAARTGCLKTAELLLEKGIDPNARPVARTPLFRVNHSALEAAVASKHHSLAKKLISFGADPNQLREKDNPRECALFDAIRGGNVRLVRKFLQIRSCQSSDGNTNALRLSVAAEHAGIDMMALFLPSVNINHYTPDGYSALTAAASGGKDANIAFLVAAGASPSRFGTAARDNLGPTPLQVYARKYGRSMDTIDLLMDRGANPNEPPQDKRFFWRLPKSERLAHTLVPSRTALQAAAELGDEELCVCLLSQGADPLARAAEFHGLTALQGAISSGNYALWDYFFMRSKSSSALPTIHAGTTALIEAIRSRNSSAVQRLLNWGCSVNDTGTRDRGRTALSEAILKRDKDLVKLLLRSGAKINHPHAQRNGGTALQAAVMTKDKKLVQSLIAKGADVFDERALWIAVRYSSIDVITTLLMAIDIKKKIHPTRTIRAQQPLQLAIKRGERNIVLNLMLSHINLNEPLSMVNCGDCMECQECMSAPRFGSWEWIEKNGFLPWDERALGTAIVLRKKDMVELLLQHGADIEFSMKMNEANELAPLTVAASTGCSEIVDILLTHGADINAPAKGRFGRTALQIAAENCRFDIVKLLLDKGADPNAPPASYGGATTLQLASMLGYIGIARMLLDHGANPNAPAARWGGRTALEGAAEHGRMDMLQLLLNYGALTGTPRSPSATKIFCFAYRAGHMAAIKLLNSHHSRTWGSELSDEIFAQEVVSTEGTWRLCDRCQCEHEEAHGHFCEGYLDYHDTDNRKDQDEDEDDEYEDDEDEDMSEDGDDDEDEVDDVEDIEEG